MRALYLTAIIVISLIASAAQAEDNQRHPIDFQVLEFNSVASQYLPRPTFAEFVVEDGEKNQLHIRADFVTPSDHVASTQNMELHWVKKKYLTEYMAGIEKFLSWEVIATRDGDFFTKEMGKFGKARMTFHSGAVGSHYLKISKCGPCDDSAYFYDRTNAEKLLIFLKDWQDGKLVESEIEDKYK